MLAVALAMVVHTLRYRSQVVTGIAFLLAYGTVALSNDDVYSLSAGVILAIGLVAIVIKMGWFELEVFGILSSYANHLYWLYRLLGPEGAARARLSRLSRQHCDPPVLLDHLSHFVRRPQNEVSDRRTYFHGGRAAQHAAPARNDEVPVGAARSSRSGRF